MQKSATALGCEYGVSGQEMNRILAKQGFLEGSPGSYSVTEKGLPYAVETDHHRGTGGYECYNRYWTTRTFDDSIKDVLNVTDDLKHEVRRELAADRAKMYATLAAERAQADAEFRAKQAAKKAAEEAEVQAALDAERLIENWKTAGKICLIVGGVIIIGYGIYRVTPKIKAWWEARRHDEDECSESDT